MCLHCCDIVAIAIPQIANATMTGLSSCMLTCNGAVQCSHALANSVPVDEAASLGLCIN